MHRFLRHFLYFLLAAFFLFLGLIILILPWSLSMQEGFREFLTIHVWTWSLLGLGFFLTGVSISTYAYYNLHTTGYTLNIGSHHVEVSAEVVEAYLENYWQTAFPETRVPCRLLLKTGLMQIFAHLPYTNLQEQRKLCNKIENDLTLIVRKALGYPLPVKLYLEFDQAKRSP